MLVSPWLDNNYHKQKCYIVTKFFSNKLNTTHLNKFYFHDLFLSKWEGKHTQRQKKNTRTTPKGKNAPTLLVRLRRVHPYPRQFRLRQYRKSPRGRSIRGDLDFPLQPPQNPANPLIRWSQLPGTPIRRRWRGTPTPLRRRRWLGTTSSSGCASLPPPSSSSPLKGQL